MEYVLCGLGSYLIGTINPSYIIARIKGFDIRKSGSGNAGGSNAVITMGGKIGVACSLADILKAYFVVILAMYLLKEPEYLHIRAISSVAVILGHMFPFYMGFKGGKGLACLGGVVLAYSSMLFVIMLASAIVLAFVTDYICFVPIAVSIVFPIIYGICEKDWIGMSIMFIASIAMVYKHTENLKRIRMGTEAHLSYLWKKDKELERIRGNVDNKGVDDSLNDPDKLNYK